MQLRLGVIIFLLAGGLGAFAQTNPDTKKEPAVESKPESVVIGPEEYSVNLTKVRKIWREVLADATANSKAVVKKVEDGYYIVAYPLTKSKRKILRELKTAMADIAAPGEEHVYKQLHLSAYPNLGYNFSENYQVWLHAYMTLIQRNRIEAFAIISETRLIREISTALGQQARVLQGVATKPEFKDNMFIVRHRDFSYPLSVPYELDRIVYTGIGIKTGAASAVATAWQILSDYEKFCNKLKATFSGCKVEHLAKRNELKITNPHNNVSILVDYVRITQTVGLSGAAFDEKITDIGKRLDWAPAIKAAPEETPDEKSGPAVSEKLPTPQLTAETRAKPAAKNERILTKKIKSAKWLEDMLAKKSKEGTPLFADMVTTKILGRVEVFAWEDDESIVWVREKDLLKEGLTSGAKLEQRFHEGLDSNFFSGNYLVVNDPQFKTPRALIIVGQNAASILIHRRVVAGALAFTKVFANEPVIEAYAPAGRVLIFSKPGESKDYLKELSTIAHNLVKSSGHKIRDWPNIRDVFDFKKHPAKPAGQFDFVKLQS